MLDAQHDKPRDFVQDDSDNNVYSWGSIGDHNVVLTSLAAGVYGTVSAAVTAQQLLSSFPHIRIGLMVGIGAALPSLNGEHDIRLGDIVVSQPDGQNGGVVQYDLGKAMDGGQFERRGMLNMPPQVLLKALSKLQAHHEFNVSRVPDYLAQMLEKNPLMAKSMPGRSSYRHPGRKHDRLFKPTYTHVSGLRDCSNCNEKEQVYREVRESEQPAIFYGTIASGDTLCKDAVTRDLIANRLGGMCICLEMEAAGLMNNFPCIVIRGICDYADSHKNDLWQRYAAATAAAYAKEFLGIIPSSQLDRSPTALSVIRVRSAQLDH
ncbi:nucleoside phosphorylase domain-containing protein [Aspergillus karnatakaensis]|uniref:5'-methylthioadenosine/S-adenosylhomocysteine nucleosidase family protein n=1 Tax=Aspergillus karnatakaensis TaxID=1810916 RepID=UPI003CCD2B5D